MLYARRPACAVILVLSLQAACGDEPESLPSTQKVAPLLAKRIKQGFDSMDVNGDGKVSVAEWTAALGEKSDVAAVDSTGDGFISFKEYQRYMRIWSPARSRGQEASVDVGAPDFEAPEEPMRKKAAAAGGDEEASGTPAARRHAPVDVPDAPAVPVRRSAPRPVRPPR